MNGSCRRALVDGNSHPFSLFPSSLPLAKDQFAHPETAELCDLLDEAAKSSGISRAQAFEDFLLLALASLSGGQMEEQYLEVAKKHAAGKKGERGIDVMPKIFGDLVALMTETRADILGDLFQGAVAEKDQFLTPEPIADLMAQMNGPEGKTVSDPCCGSGRMLLASAKVNRNREFIGQDIDLRCVRITAINLALRNLYGYVLWGNSLALEKKLVYRTGFNGRGFLREIPVEECPALVRQAMAKLPAADEGFKKRDGGRLRLF